MKLKDSRIKLMNEILNGIKVFYYFFSIISMELYNCKIVFIIMNHSENINNQLKIIDATVTNGCSVWS